MGRRLHPADRRRLDDAQMAELEAVAPGRSAWRCWSKCTTRASSTGPAAADAAGRHQQPQPAHVRDALETTLELLPRMPAGRLVVTESGIASRADVAAHAGRGRRMLSWSAKPSCARPTRVARWQRCLVESAATRRRPREAAPVADNRLREPLDALIGRLTTDWRPIVDAWRSSREGAALVEFVDARVRAGAAVYPGDVFAALRLTPLECDEVGDPRTGPVPRPRPVRRPGVLGSCGDASCHRACATSSRSGNARVAGCCPSRATDISEVGPAPVRCF